MRKFWLVLIASILVCSGCSGHDGNAINSSASLNVSSAAPSLSVSSEGKEEQIKTSAAVSEKETTAGAAKAGHSSSSAAVSDSTEAASETSSEAANNQALTFGNYWIEKKFVSVDQGDKTYLSIFPEGTGKEPHGKFKIARTASDKPKSSPQKWKAEGLQVTREEFDQDKLFSDFSGEHTDEGGYILTKITGDDDMQKLIYDGQDTITLYCKSSSQIYIRDSRGEKARTYNGHEIYGETFISLLSRVDMGNTYRLVCDVFDSAPFPASKLYSLKTGDRITLDNLEDEPRAAIIKDKWGDGCYAEYDNPLSEEDAGRVLTYPFMGIIAMGYPMEEESCERFYRVLGRNQVLYVDKALYDSCIQKSEEKSMDHYKVSIYGDQIAAIKGYSYRLIHSVS